mmetsp:Transcript_10735/g.66206  ORF Transcript_10735/g.66206 Transcript_10735/m.66206 type:complete len:214 (-) Transcript_10735:1274-1915(-)
MKGFCTGFHVCVLRGHQSLLLMWIPSQVGSGDWLAFTQTHEVIRRHSRQPDKMQTIRFRHRKHSMHRPGHRGSSYIMLSPILRWCTYPSNVGAVDGLEPLFCIAPWGDGWNSPRCSLVSGEKDSLIPMRALDPISPLFSDLENIRLRFSCDLTFSFLSVSTFWNSLVVSMSFDCRFLTTVAEWSTFCLLFDPASCPTEMLCSSASDPLRAVMS